MDHFCSVSWIKKKRQHNTHNPWLTMPARCSHSYLPRTQRRPFTAFQPADTVHLFPGRRYRKTEASSRGINREGGHFERTSPPGIDVSGKKPTFAQVLNRCFTCATWIMAAGSQNRWVSTCSSARAEKCLVHI